VQATTADSQGRAAEIQQGETRLGWAATAEVMADEPDTEAQRNLYAEVFFFFLSFLAATHTAEEIVMRMNLSSW